MIGASRSTLLLEETLSANEDSHENHGPSKMTTQFRTSEMRSVRVLQQLSVILARTCVELRTPSSLIFI